MKLQQGILLVTRDILLHRVAKHSFGMVPCRMDYDFLCISWKRIHKLITLWIPKKCESITVQIPVLILAPQLLK